MSEADDRLRALFAAEEPPARDPAFELAVLEKIALRDFQLDLAAVIAFGLAGGGLLWLLWPSLGPALAGVGQGLAPAAVAVSLAALVVAAMGLRPADIER